MPHHGVCLPEVGCPSCSTNVGLAEHKSCHIMECVSLRLVALHAVPMLVWLNTDRATSWSVSPWGCPSCSTNVGLAEHRSCHIMECVSLGLVALHAVPMLVWLNTDRATSWSVSPWGCPSCSTNVGLAEHRSCHIMECVSLRLVALHAVPMLVWLNTDHATSWSVSP